jgi:hypothetical protein
MKSKWRLERNVVTMWVGNGQHVDVVAVGTLHLRLPSRFILVLNKCYYVPALSMNILSGSQLSWDGYHFESITNGCSISKDDILYVHTPNHDGLYILDLNCNEIHMNSVDSKRYKLSDDNTTYMWHCRLGHIGMKHMKMLHSDGLLGSLDFDSFDTCEPCLMGKMTRTPFTSFVERATDLLWIIHTDMCGPMSVATRNAMVIVTLWHLLMIWVDMGISIWWSISLKPLKSSRNFRMRSKINLIGKSSTFILIEGASIWASSLRCILRNVELFHNVRQLECCSVTVCLSNVTALCSIVWDPWWLCPTCQYRSGVMR